MPSDEQNPRVFWIAPRMTPVGDPVEKKINEQRMNGNAGPTDARYESCQLVRFGKQSRRSESRVGGIFSECFQTFGR